MNELTQFNRINRKFQKLLLASVRYFRKGDDHSGLDAFLNSMDQLEDLLDNEPDIKTEALFSALSLLHEYMKNQDVVGMADLIEFTIYPLAKKRFKGTGET